MSFRATFYFTNSNYRLILMTSPPKLILINEGLMYLQKGFKSSDQYVSEYLKQSTNTSRSYGTNTSDSHSVYTQFESRLKYAVLTGFL
jgi:small-conductance mechanosensitive channel